MIADFWEDFLLLRREDTPDGAGGAAQTWTEESFFRGGLARCATAPVRPGDAPMAQVQRWLTHEPGVRLLPEDRVKRVQDGALWRVLGDSREDCTPARCAQPFAQVKVERLVDGA